MLVGAGRIEIVILGFRNLMSKRSSLRSRDSFKRKILED